MLKIAHIVNPVKLGETSDLYIAQPITFETMRRARAYAQNQVEVQLYSTQYPEDHEILPEGFTILPDLERSILDFQSFEIKRKLPLLKDILGLLYEATDADYLIYSNVDIALMPYFYTTVAHVLQDYDALIINRRTISNLHTEIVDIPLMYAELGAKHPGYDCFIFRREIYPQFQLGQIVIGAANVALLLYANLLAFSENLHELKDAHLTFHLGDDRVWTSQKMSAYSDHNAKHLLDNLMKLKNVVGTFDEQTALGRFLLDIHFKYGIDMLIPLLEPDNPSKSFGPRPPTFRQKAQRKLARHLRELADFLVRTSKNQ